MYSDFRPSEMVSNLSSKVARAMYTLSFGKFKSKLIMKSREYDVDVIICSEAYTTKTCTRCGTENDVGVDEIYKCNKCKLVIGRDNGASRNIMMRNITYL